MDTGGTRFISPKELQRIIRCGRTFAYGLLASGEIPSYKVGKLRRIDLRNLEANTYPSAE